MPPGGGKRDGSRVYVSFVTHHTQQLFAVGNSFWLVRLVFLQRPFTDMGKHAPFDSAVRTTLTPDQPKTIRRKTIVVTAKVSEPDTTTASNRSKQVTSSLGLATMVVPCPCPSFPLLSPPLVSATAPPITLAETRTHYSKVLSQPETGRPTAVRHLPRSDLYVGVRAGGIMKLRTAVRSSGHLP